MPTEYESSIGNIAAAVGNDDKETEEREDTAQQGEETQDKEQEAENTGEDKEEGGSDSEEEGGAPEEEGEDEEERIEVPAEIAQRIYDAITQSLEQLLGDSNISKVSRVTVPKKFTKQLVEYYNDEKRATEHAQTVIALQKVILGETLSVEDETLLKRYAYLRPGRAVYVPTPQYINKQPGASRVKVKSSGLANRLMDKQLYAGIVDISPEILLQRSVNNGMADVFSTVRGEKISSSIKELPEYMRRLFEESEFYVVLNDDGSVNLSDHATYFEKYVEALGYVIEAFKDNQKYEDFVEEYGRFLKGLGYDKDVVKSYNRLINKFLELEDINGFKSARTKLSNILIKKVSEYVMAMYRLQNGTLVLMPKSEIFGGIDYIELMGEDSGLININLISVKSARGKTPPRKIGAASGARSHLKLLRLSENDNVDNISHQLFDKLLQIASKAYWVRRNDFESDMEFIDKALKQLSDMSLEPNQTAALKGLEELVENTRFENIANMETADIQDINKRVGELMFRFAVGYLAEYESVLKMGNKIRVERSKPEPTKSNGLLGIFKPFNKMKEATIAWYYERDKEHQPDVIIDEDDNEILGDFEVMAVPTKINKGEK